MPLHYIAIAPLLHNVEDDVALAVSYLVHRRGGPGCLVSMVSLRYSSSPPCPSCQSLPGSCCWTKETVRPARTVWLNIFGFRGSFLQINVCFNSLWCYHHLNLLLCHTPLALRRLWGKKDYSREVEEMLEEKAALERVRSHSVVELIQNRTVRWQLLTITVTFTTLQLCGINAVSDIHTLNTLLHKSSKMLTALWDTIHSLT